MYFGADKKDANWISFGFDDTHHMDTVPYQITRNFEEVLKLASSKKVLDPTQYERFYFEDNEELSRKASFSFKLSNGKNPFGFWILTSAPAWGTGATDLSCVGGDIDNKYIAVLGFPLFFYSPWNSQYHGQSCICLLPDCRHI